MRYLLRKAAHRAWNQPKIKRHVATNKSEKSWKSEQHLEVTHEVTVFGVYPAGFHSCSGPVFLCYVPFHIFLNGNVSTVPLWCGKSFCICVDFIG